MGAAAIDGGSGKDKAAAPLQHPGSTADAWRAYCSNAAWVALWITLSVSIIIVNKQVIGYSGFRFPITLALWHMLLGTCTSRAVLAAQQAPDAIREARSRSLNLQLAGVGVLFGGVLVTGNAALMYLTVPTVQMLKASGPAVIYATGILMGAERLSLTQGGRVAVVCAGVGIASYGDLTLSAAGVVLQIVSILMDAVRCCGLQRVLQTAHVECGPLLTLAYVAPAAAAALLLPAAALEGPRLLRDFALWRGAVPMVLLSGVLASLLNLVVFKIIALTSALTTSLCGVLKEWATILVAMAIYHTAVQPLQWLGYSIAICGLLLYQHARIRGASARLAQQEPPVHAGGSGDDAGHGRAVYVQIRSSAGSRASMADSSSWGSAGGSADDDAAWATGGAASRTSHGGSVPLLRTRL